MPLWQRGTSLPITTCTGTNFGFVIQAFSDPQRGVLMGFRRRDGSIDSYVTGDIYQVRLPAHVNVRRIKPDVD